MPVVVERPITVVLAENAHDFERWCHEHAVSPYSRNVVYASSPRKVDGMRGFEVMRTTHWREHPQAESIAQVVQRNLVRQGK